MTKRWRGFCPLPKRFPRTRWILVFAPGRVLAADVVAGGNLPPFDNSAVDGYAVGAYRGGTVNLVGTVLAGQEPARSLGAGEAMYVATGAMIPVGTTGIVMIEDADADANTVSFREPPTPRSIRRAGSDVRMGETVLRAGDMVDVGAVGLLASLGMKTIPCHFSPAVGVLSTGDELVPMETRPLPPAKIRDSNSLALLAAARAAGAGGVGRLHAPDDREAIRDALLSLSSEYDVIVSSGGVSVGSADFVKEIVEEIGTLDFWRIAIKPGKPLAFGRIGDALFFGLPGNPVSSLVTFELFVRPVLRRLAGHRDTGRPRIVAMLSEDLPHEEGRREFVRAHVRFDTGAPVAHVTGGQGSHRTASMVGANALVIAHESHGDYAAGDTLPTLLLV